MGVVPSSVLNSRPWGVHCQHAATVLPSNQLPKSPLVSTFEKGYETLMRRLSSRRGRAVVFLLMCQWLLANTAHAYLDPGTGSYVFQMVIAVFLSAAFTIKHYWHSLKARFARRDTGETSDNPPAP